MRKKAAITQQPELLAAMENSSLATDVYHNVTTSAQDDDGALTLYLANIRDLALKVMTCSQGHIHHHRNSRYLGQPVRSHRFLLLHQDH